MLNSDEEIFFDSLDSPLSPQDSQSALLLATKQQDIIDHSRYQAWLDDPLISVKERRQLFLQKMGLPHDKNHPIMLRDCENAVSNSLTSTSESTKVATFEERKVSHEEEEEHRVPEMEADQTPQEYDDAFDTEKNRINSWSKRFERIKRGILGSKMSSKGKRETSKSKSYKSKRMSVKQNRKKWKELSALYFGQEIRAHKGLIWTIKFSPNGQYLASGGQDGVIRVWRVRSTDTSGICVNSAVQDTTSTNIQVDITCAWKKQTSQSFVVLPSEVLQIEESPIQEFYGHSSDVLDLAWSDSDILLSSSMDKTVRMWRIGCTQSLRVFRHNDYVTCIQFNPVDGNYFISGSIDGKVRVWGVHEERVVDWADIRDVITAISYKPDGKGFVVGSIAGACRFYGVSGKQFQLEAEIWVQGKRKSASNRITGIQFSQNKHQRVIITSEDSKVRVLDGVELVQKFRGLPKSGSQMSGSFTSSGKHIISIGDDSQVYIWNSSDSENPSSKRTKKSERSCEYFFAEGVTVAVPWSGMMSKEQRSCPSSHSEASPGGSGSSARDSDRFSLGNWFSMDGTCRGSVTWPEEKLPGWDLQFAEDEYETWGLSIVAGGLDGSIKTFHNFGLPVRL